MNTLKKINTKALCIIIVVAVAVLSSLMFFGREIYFSPLKDRSDSTYYYVVSEVLTGDTSNIGLIEGSGFGTRFLIPFLAIPLMFFMPLNYAFATVNLVLWMITAIIILEFFTKFFKSASLGFLTSLFFCTSLPVIAYGSRPLMDLGSWCMMIWLIVFYEMYMKRLTLKNLAKFSALFAIALLQKESAMYFFVYLGLDVLFRAKKNFGKAFVHGLKSFIALLVGMVPAVLWQLVTKTSWFKQRPSQVNYQSFTLGGVWNLVFRSFVAFHIIFLPFLVGLFADKNKDRRLFYIKVSAPAIIVILYSWIFAPPFSPRFSFFLFPAVLPIGAYGLERIAVWVKNRGLIKNTNTVIILFVILYWTVSYFGASLFPAENVRVHGDLIQLVINTFKSRWLGQ